MQIGTSWSALYSPSHFSNGSGALNILYFSMQMLNNNTGYLVTLLTLNLNGPSGGLAYGTPINALIGRPLYDRR